MKVEATVEKLTGCGSITFRGSPVGVHLQERIFAFNIECGIISTGNDGVCYTHDVTTERSITVSYPVDPIVAESAILPVGTFGTLIIKLDDSRGGAEYNQAWAKVVYSKVVSDIVYHRFVWVEAN